MRSLLAVLVAAASTLGGHHPPPKKAPGPIAIAERGLASALAGGELNAVEVADYRAVLRRAGRAVGKLPGDRRESLSGAIHDVSRLWRGYTRQRALVLFTMLDENIRYFSAHGAPADGTDVVGNDGTVYRFFP